MAIMIPQSWSDCGMDWNNPDPGNIFYALALKEAICERAAVTGINLPTGRFIHLPDLLRLRTFDFIKWVRTSINTLAPYFMDVEYDRYFEKDAPIQETDFPKMYKASEFQEKIQYSFLALPYKSINSDYVNFFKGAKQALDMMRYTKVQRMHGHIIKKDGTNHDPPSVSEAINEAIKNANGNSTDEFISADTFSGRVGSGTTHYNNNPGYCGYVWNYTVEIDHIFPFPDDRKPDILCFGLAYKCTDNVSYSNETQYNDFWCSPFRIY